MANKTTKREYFAILTNIVEASDRADREEILTFIAHEVELLDRKSSKSGMTATQKANIEVKSQIETALREVGKPVTISELMASSPVMAGYSNQKLSALLNRMSDVVKTTEKKKSYFSLAE